jgi:SpoVK/Ycf46/Vps4 family AAA+-type ATPase
MTEQTVKPFATNLEYITAGLEYLQSLARLRLVEQRLQLKRSSVKVCRWEDNALESVFGEVDDTANGLQQLRRELHADLRRRHRQLRARTEMTMASCETALPLETLAREHGLTKFEKNVLLIVLGPDLDSSFGRLLEALNHTRSVEIRVVLDLLCDTLEQKIKARKLFIHSGNLLGHGLLNMAYSRRDAESETEFMSMDLMLPRRVSSLILGEYDIDDQIISFSSVIDPVVDLDQVVLPSGKKDEVLQIIANRDDYCQCRMDWGFDQILPYGKGTILLFHGPSGTGKTMLAHALAGYTGHRLMLVDIRKVANHSKREFEENLERVFHEARLQHAIAFFDEADEMFTDRSLNGAMPTLLREFEKLDGIAILATNRKQVLDEALERRILYRLHLDIPTPELRAEIWQKHLPPTAPLADDIDVAKLADEFEFAGGFIKNAVLMAMHRALQRPTVERRITHEDLRASAVLQRRNRLDSQTDKITPRVGLSDVRLPADVKEQLDEIVEAARKRSTVYSSWGFGKKMSLGKAISALFIGESGVGKTMTAEAIACELGQNLYPVRLSAVISKYVGETEKHLTRVFRDAAEAQAILFFDEADALFSARIGDGSHHAHYINQQINVLLTEVEKFDGMVILATNRPDALDVAFERRIRYRITFPMPDTDVREAIWRQHIPEEAPMAEAVDFPGIASDYAFTGGTIRNVVLRAAFQAAMDGGVITETMLRSCADREQKLIPERVIGFAGTRQGR